MEKPHPPTDDGRKSRSDGVQSRERLLMAAMRLFAEQGFSKTSTREIALAAGTNIASISYYFGDKAGLYRAAFTEPSPHPPDNYNFTDPTRTLREALAEFYVHLLGPLKQGDMARLSMRLWFREMLEPTGLWNEEIERDIRPALTGMVQLFARHMNLKEPDDDLYRLAFSIVGMAIQIMLTRDVIDKIVPQLLETEAAVDIWLARLVDYAEALVNAEQVRRTALAAQNTPP